MFNPNNAEVVSLSDLPLPRIQLRWEAIPEDECAIIEQGLEKGPDDHMKRYGYRCHHEYVVPWSYHDEERMNGTAPLTDGSRIEACVSELITTTPEHQDVRLTNNGVEFTETNVRPRVPAYSPLDPEYFSNGPVFVISSTGKIWKLADPQALNKAKYTVEKFTTDHGGKGADITAPDGTVIVEEIPLYQAEVLVNHLNREVD